MIGIVLGNAERVKGSVLKKKDGVIRAHALLTKASKMILKIDVKDCST